MTGTDPVMMFAVFALQDSFGTACNITGDEALTLILSGYAEKQGIKTTEFIDNTDVLYKWHIYTIFNSINISIN